MTTSEIAVCLWCGVLVDEVTQSHVPSALGLLAVHSAPLSLFLLVEIKEGVRESRELSAHRCGWASATKRR